MTCFAVVEDEHSSAVLLEGYIKKFMAEKMPGEKYYISLFSDGDEIVSSYRGKFDIIFMDIEMNLMNGMEAAEEIRKTDSQVIIIFVTNMAQYAVKGYKVNAMDYILKPFSYEQFVPSMRKALDEIRHNKDRYVMIKCREGIIRLKAEEIFYVESCGHRLTFHTMQGDFETTVTTIKQLMNELADADFSQCSSGILVNLRHVQSLKGNTVEVGGANLLVSRGKKAEFTQNVVRYMTR